MGKKKGKKGKGDDAIAYLGRPSNNVKVGIVGLPNVGKSSFFNLICKMDVPAENFPFCTIEPTTSRVPVPDKRFDQLCKAFKPKKEIPAVLTVVDIAGLVKGASEGAGLGNAFLSNIQSVDAIFHQIRTFKDKDVTHVENTIDPLRDIEIINHELKMKDIRVVENLVESKRKNISRGAGDKEAKEEFATLEKTLAYLKETGHVRFGVWSTNEIIVLNSLQLLTAKPQVYLINMSEKNYCTQRSNWLPKLQELVGKLGGEPMIPYSVAFEKKLFDMGPEAAAEFCTKNKVKSMFPVIIKKGYHALNLIHFFTVGADEVRAWSIRNGYLAPQAAGTIHTDFERGFICAKIYRFKDFKQNGQSEQTVKAKGLLKQQGRKYLMLDGDICHFEHNVAEKKKAKKK